MTRFSLSTAFALALSLFASAAHAQWTVEVEGGDRLRINSGFAGPETIRVTRNPAGALVITNSRVRQPQVIQQYIRIISFNGDNDRDVFYNDTDITCFAWGGGGNDSLHGGSGTDTLQGGDGRDDLYGNDGNDFLYPGQDFHEGEVHGGSGTNHCDVTRFWAIYVTLRPVFGDQEFDLFTHVNPQTVFLEIDRWQDVPGWTDSDSN